MDSLRRARVPLALLVAMAGVLIAAYAYDAQARALPVLVAATTIGLLVLETLVQAGTRIGRRIEALLASGSRGAPEPERVALARALIYALAWPAFVVALTILIGILPAVFIYVCSSLKIAAGKSLPRALTTGLAVTVLAWLLFELGMSYELYRGVLFDR